MATMGDQNDVTPDTLNRMMRGYNLIGKKGSGRMRPVTGNVGKGKMKIHEIDVNEGMYEYNRADPFDSEFSLTLDGIGGFGFGQAITSTRIPSSITANRIFQVTAVEHSVTAQDWTTTINTIARLKN